MVLNLESVKKSHIRKEHLDLKPFNCVECGEITQNEIGSKTHSRFTHFVILALPLSLGHKLTLRRQCTKVNTVNVMDLNMASVNDHHSRDERPL